MSDPIVIVSAARTPIGSMLGCFTSVSANELGAVAIKAAVERAGIDASKVDEVIMGNVLQAGQGQAPARQAALKAGLPDAVPCSTINKMCGSGMKSVQLAHDLLKADSCKVAIAGGQESMTNAPHLLLNARQGYRYGNGNRIYDHMALDGLEDAYQPGTPMGIFAEECAGKYNFTREAQDDFALSSLDKASKAIENGCFDWETAPVTVKTRKGEETVTKDELPGKAKPEKIPSLRPAFKKDGTVTAANASAISDGAAALVLMRESTAKELGCKPLAKIVAHSQHSHEPEWFTTAPVGAIKKTLDKAGWSADEVDLYEINEAFAVVTMAATKELNLDPKKVNMHGGATALGHPIGASGARLIVTLLGALRETKGKKGVASLCIGGGEAVALAVEML